MTMEASVAYLEKGSMRRRREMVKRESKEEHGEFKWLKFDVDQISLIKKVLRIDAYKLRISEV